MNDENEGSGPLSHPTQHSHICVVFIQQKLHNTEMHHYTGHNTLIRGVTFNTIITLYCTAQYRIRHNTP